MTEREIFDAALDFADIGERAAFLDRACAGDDSLRRQIEDLLNAQCRLGQFLDMPSGWLTSIPRESGYVEKPGTVIGPYHLIEQIGEGGFGLVFVAEQREPVQRQVALKVIKPGMDSREIMARFAVERQALALMDHPNIAKVFDAGATDSGRPYFVMELVRGIPITDFCDQHQFSPRKRLELFLSVCQAVQHAHQKGIIHRDIKPSNILVSVHNDVPDVKVIDFGIAKAVNRQFAERKVFTTVAQLIGTPLYMSPEQAEMTGLDVDTRSDIYSLGVLLYELLTGTTPFDKTQFAQAAYDEIRRIIREEEPEKPSNRLSQSKSLNSVAAHRMMEQAKLSKAVAGDLDWITMKALEKDRTRRYATANGLARDIERYLCDEPVEARPPSARYRFRKFVLRNKGAVIAASLILLMLIGGIVGTSWGLYQAEAARRDEALQRVRAESNEKVADQERRAATRQAELAQAVTKFLQSDMLALASVEGQYEQEAAYLGKDVQVRNLLDRAAKNIEGQFTQQPLVEAEIRWTIGVTYRRLGEPQLAIPHLMKCVTIRRQQLGDDDPSTMNAMNSLAVAYHDDRRHAESLQLIELVCNTKSAKFGPDHPSTLRSLGSLAVALGDNGRLDESIRLLEQTRESQSVKLGADDTNTLLTCNNLAQAYRNAERLTDAIQLFEHVRDARIAKLGGDHPDTLITMERLAGAYREFGKLTEAIRLFEHVRDLQTAKLGADHLVTLITLHNLALAYKEAKRLPEAIALFEQVRDARSKRLGIDHVDTLITLNCLASAYREAERLQEAIQLYEHVRDVRTRKLGADHPETLVTLSNLAMTYRVAGRLEEAIRLYEHVRDVRTAKLGAEHPDTLLSMSNLMRAYKAAERLSEAIQLGEQASSIATIKLGPSHATTLLALNNLAHAYQSAGRIPEAIQLFEKVKDTRVAKLSADHPDTLIAFNSLAQAFKVAGRQSDVIRTWEQLRDLLVAKIGIDRDETLIAMTNLGSAYKLSGKYSDAARTYEQVCLVRISKLGIEHDATLRAVKNLGIVYLADGQADKAEAQYRTLLSAHEKVESGSWQSFDAKSLLGGALGTQKKTELAEQMLLAGYNGLRQLELKIPIESRQTILAEATIRLIHFYDANGNPNESAKWRKELDTLKTAAKSKRGL